MFELNPQPIRDALFQSGVGVRDFAKLVGLNEFTLKKILTGDAKVSSKVIGKLAKALNVEGSKFLKE